ncbi:MAG: Cof-type HAD-IIB family hydrolase [Clostridia bacterium]|nr:Cof-type HAD-IIB family hydrolase [Clostridia bacterium]
MNVQLVASDLDGTLLNNAGAVSCENWEAIEEMGKRGIHFVPASGRCFMELPAEIRESDLIRYYILSGGAVIFDKKEDRFEMICPSKTVKDLVLDTIFRYSVCLFAHIGRESCVDEKKHQGEIYASFNMNEYWVQYALEKETPVSDFKHFVYDLEKVPMMVVFFRDPKELSECRSLLQQNRELLVVQSDPYNLEIVSKKAGKGNTLLALADLLGIDRRNTLAVGDGHNDRTMLEKAGLSLAMKNAVPEIRDLADEVICDNDSHCAAYILEHYCSEKEG